MSEGMITYEMTVIQRYRESHQAVAMMVAAGCTPSMIRRQTGVSQRRLTLLLGSPSFQELVAIYADKVEEKFNVNLDAYLDLGMANMIRAEAQISDHLDKSEEEGGELLPVGVLDRISQGRADRFGYSKHSTIHHELDFAAAMDRAITRSGKGEALKQIEGRVVEAPQPSLPSPQEPVAATSPTTVAQPPQPARSFARVLDPIKRRRVA